MITRITYFSIIPILFLMGCSQTSVLMESDPEQEVSEPDYTIVVYIHGDSDYLFHDGDGNRTEADQHALSKAMDIAVNAGSGEVFVYHHQPAKRFLWMIPRRTNELYHFINGEKVRHIKYRRSSDELFLQTEADFFQKHSISQNKDHQAYFVYFGHEIPEKNYKGYHQSQSDIVVDTETFARGAQSFLDSDDALFDLMVLSTCSNGTPAMVKQLSGITNYLLASPLNLHLSYIDITSLKLLETNPQISANELATEIAEESYDRLSDSIQTVISLSVYDINAVEEYVENLLNRTLSYREAENPNPFYENIDCAELSFFDQEKFTSGVQTFFRPARFGHRSSGNSHSGWGCKGD